MSLAAATSERLRRHRGPTMSTFDGFTSVVFLEGPAKFLFTPLGLAVGFAMLASYTLCTTLTPVIIGLLLKGERHSEGSEGWFAFSRHFDRGFERFHHGYVRARDTAQAAAHRPGQVAALMLALGGVMLTTAAPPIDGGQIKLHVRAPEETRIEPPRGIFRMSRIRSEKSFGRRDRDLIVDDFGVPQRLTTSLSPTARSTSTTA